MFEPDDPDWLLVDHLLAGKTALAQIALNPKSKLPQWVCHHFSELVPTDQLVVNITELYTPLVSTFEQLGLVLEPDRLEAWEKGLLTDAWLNDKIPKLFALAAREGLRYQGWSWEPDDEQPVCATNFPILNNRIKTE